MQRAGKRSAGANAAGRGDEGREQKIRIPSFDR